ncbi:hypothetical protein [Helicobacter sp. 23-1045]
MSDSAIFGRDSAIFRQDSAKFVESTIFFNLPRKILRICKSLRF